MHDIVHLIRTLASFVLVLGVLITFHELGHYLAARWRGIYVEAFSIGFGPALVSWKDRRGTVWKICVLPLGGFVKMHGMAVNVADENAIDMTSVRPGEAYFEKSVASRSIVTAAGPIANFLLAFVLFTALFVVVGQPVPLAVVGEVAPGSSAADAHLQPGDEVRSVDGHPIAVFEDLRRLVAGSVGRTLQLSVHRGTQDLTVPVTVKAVSPAEPAIGRLGITSSSGRVSYVGMGPIAAARAGASQTWSVFSQTLQGLAHLVTTGSGVHELGGPIAIAGMAGKVAELGVASLVNFIALLSINLGLMNLLPIPILDGGHLMFYAAEAVRGRPLPPRALDYGFRIGFAIVGSLFVFISWNDLVHNGAVHWVAHLFG